MNIFKHCIILILLLLIGTSQAVVKNISYLGNDSKKKTYYVSISDTTYHIKEVFSTWKESIYTRNDSIFIFYLTFIGYEEGKEPCNATAMYDFNLNIYRLDSLNNLNHIVYDGPNCRSENNTYNITPIYIKVDKLDSLYIDTVFQKYIPDSVKIVSIINDTTNNDIPRTTISWVYYQKAEIGYLYNESCGIAIFEFYDNWVLKYYDHKDNERWQDTAIYDMNKTGFKEIILRYVSVGGSGFTYHMDLIQRKQ